MTKKIFTTFILAVSLCCLVAGCASEKFTVSIASSTPASNSGKYSAASECTVTAVESYTSGGKNYVKVTQTMTVTSSPKYGAYLYEYAPKAYQNGVSIDKADIASDGNKDKEVVAGGSLSTCYYYPVGDYSDITLTFGYDGTSIGQTAGKAIIHMEKA